MKERPILFSAPMVRAILEGRKTQTRRVVKFPMNEWFDMQGVEADEREQHYRDGLETCPYGQPGDRLWVRETFTWIHDTEPEDERKIYLYKADSINFDVKWKPSIHIPRIASRILLEIIGVRVERLNDISEQDAKAEGVELYNNYDGTFGGHDAPTTYKAGFCRLWESINGAGSWKENPWVWVIEFKRVEVKS